MTRAWTAVLAVAVLTTSAVAAAAPDPHAAEKAAIARSVNTFAWDLYGRVRGEKGNLFFSPYSISSALAMTYAGARGPTADQMAEALQLPADWRAGPERIHAAFGHLSADLNAQGKTYELTVANRLWGQKGYGFLAGFLGLVGEHYGAGLAELDFARDTEGSRKTINTWVEKETKDRIKDLIPRGGVQPLTRLVLTNAIYFKGTWQTPFTKDRTRDADFFAPGGKVTVPMMGQTKHFRYAEADGCQTVELPYKGGELAMVVLLPKEREGLAAVEKSRSADVLAQRLAALKHENVALALPRFTMTWGALLADHLKAMGMPLAFDMAKADFTAMNGGKEPLGISEVIHKAFVDVNEEGTEAAAATAIDVWPTEDVAPPPEFRADHPFLFLIRDLRSGAILFMGRVVDPKA